VPVRPRRMRTRRSEGAPDPLGCRARQLARMRALIALHHGKIRALPPILFDVLAFWMDGVEIQHSPVYRTRLQSWEAFMMATSADEMIRLAAQSVHTLPDQKRARQSRPGDYSVRVR
jgi:hypothetical protein